MTAVCSIVVEARLDVRVQHPAVAAGAEDGGSRRSRPGPAAWAGTRRRPAGSRPRRWVPAPASAPPGRPGPRCVGIPSLRTFPDPPGLGILRSRTGSGRNEPSFKAARRSSRNPGTPTCSSTSATVRPSTPGVFAPAVARDPVERHDQRRRVVHEVEQVIEPAAGIGHRPTVKLGLHLRYPSPAAPAGPERRSAAIRRRVFRHCSLLPFSKPLPPFPMCAGFPRLGVLRRLRPVPARSAVGAPSPARPRWRRAARRGPGRFPCSL